METTLTTAPAPAAPTVTRYRCANEMCFTAEPAHLLCFAWAKTWAQRGVIDRFYLFCKPSPHQLSPGIDVPDPCFSVPECEWLNLDALIAHPLDFIETLKHSPLRITTRAAKDLLPFVFAACGWTEQTPQADESLRQIINGDTDFFGPTKR